ncbi:MAG: DNA/RNA non-specific endonuclease [Wujia sp.]
MDNDNVNKGKPRRSENKRKKLSMGCVVIGLILLFGVAVNSENADDAPEPSTEVNTEAGSESTREDTTEETTATLTTEKMATTTTTDASAEKGNSFDIEIVPAYAGYAYVPVNDNLPYFTEEEKHSVTAFETYSELDDLGRCGAAFANVCRELQPTEPRGEIGSIKPSGWHTVKYNDIISDNYLYNRCHLIGYQLTGENANEKNLITGTRYLNMAGMLPFEDKIACYLEENDNHVLYRVTPIFDGDNLVASGVLLEGYSVEDAGAGICFNVYCYNVQPGICIDYATGDSHEDPSVVAYDDNYESAIHRDNMEETVSDVSMEVYASDGETDKNASGEKSITVWISATGNKYHRKNNCGSMNPNNATELTKEQAESLGYEPCGKCY